jgi:hypothetical protein
MIDDSECFFLWAVPTWEHWAESEKARRTHPKLVKWRHRAVEEAAAMERVLLVDSPLCPFRTHRQPARTDQVDWDE